MDASSLPLDLDGCIEKLRRAHEHLADLDQKLRMFFNSDPYRALGKVEGEHGWYVFRAEPLRQPPLRIGVLTGEVVHQVRSIFDNLVWALACWHMHPKSPPSRLGFPIKTSPGGAGRRATDRLAKYIPDDWSDLIEAMQPYGAHDHPLAILDRLWNRDKHQVLIPMPVTQAMSLGTGQQRPYRDIAAVTERRTRVGVRLVEGAELVRTRIEASGPNPHMDMYMLTAVEVPGEGGIDLVHELFLCCSYAWGLLSIFPTVSWQQPIDPRLFTAYTTAISTMPDETVARERGFVIPAAHFRRP